MIKWYEDEDIQIRFSEKPDIIVQYIEPELSVQKKKEICNKPFLLKNKIDVVLSDLINDETYEFTIPKGYCWDGASIPRVFWRLIGAKTDNRFLIPSLIHDVLCENHGYVNCDRYFSTIVFERLLYVSGVNSFNRWLMKHSVDNYQKFCSWGK